MASLLQALMKQVTKGALYCLGKIIATPIRRQLYAFETATQNPRAVQLALLDRIVKMQTASGYGRDHRFDTIRDVADFRRQVPVAGYEAFEPYIERMRRGEFEALIAGQQVHMFALTSGTTSSRKYIPVTDAYLDAYRKGWNLWGLKAFRDHPDIKFRPILQFSSDSHETETEAGTPCGSVTGLTAKTQKKLIQWLYCTPFITSKVKDAAAKYYLVMRLSIPRSVRLLIAANPSTMINLARAGDRDKELLIRDIHDGTLTTKYDIPDEVRQALRWRLRAKPARARELQAIADRTGTLYPRDYWPSECLLGNWTGGSVGAYLRHYPQYFGSMPIRDVGLIASEGRMTIPFADNTPAGILDVTSHFFEFIPEEEGDSLNPTALMADELIEGKTYYILPTTAYGLYRYHIRDVVRVVGFHNKTPLIEFLSKGSHFSNLTGEKLSEYHITGAMKQILDELNLKLTTYSVAPCWPDTNDGDEVPYYGLFIERDELSGQGQGQRLIERLEICLRERNIEYACKRDTLRLGAIRLHLIPNGAWQDWDRKRLSKTGGSLEQYKHPCLISDLKFKQTMPLAFTPLVFSSSVPTYYPHAQPSSLWIGTQCTIVPALLCVNSCSNTAPNCGATLIVSSNACCKPVPAMPLTPPCSIMQWSPNCPMISRLCLPTPNGPMSALLFSVDLAFSTILMPSGFSNRGPWRSASSPVSS